MSLEDGGKEDSCTKKSLIPPSPLPRQEQAEQERKMEHLLQVWPGLLLESESTSGPGLLLLTESFVFISPEFYIITQCQVRHWR